MNLGVNIDHVATVRQARRGSEPDLISALIHIEKAGADSIVAHLREDRRHINDNDIKLIKELAATSFNMEMSLAEEIVEVAFKTHPDEVTFVPEKREEITTEGGLDVIKNKKRLLKVIPEFKRNKIKVSLFIDPEEKQVKEALEVGADFIEIHTGRYSEAFAFGDYIKELNRIKETASFAKSLSLDVNAGHGLDYRNVFEIVKIEEIETLNIGHSIISRALFVGFENAVKEMLEFIK